MLRLPLDGTANDDPYRLPDSLDGRRLSLAKWIAHPNNHLATRSIVNRVWQQHFGVGLAANANNFGVKGTKPTHPELLDFLAADFVANGGTLKRLHRLVLTSQTYRQSSRMRNAELGMRNEDRSAATAAVAGGSSIPQSAIRNPTNCWRTTARGTFRPRNCGTRCSPSSGN